MKQTFLGKILLLSLLSIFALGTVNAQKGDPNLDRQNSHFFTISLSGGASGYMMTPSYSVNGILSENANFDDNNKALPIALMPEELEISAFGGGSFGVGYEYQMARGFWFSLGLEAQMLMGGLHHTDSIHRIDDVLDGDKVPEEASVEYTVINWNERQTNFALNVPVLLGYKHESGMYFGVGAKLGYTLRNKIDGDFGFADCNLYYEGREPIMGIYEELPLENVVSRDKNFENLLQVSPMVEIGWQGLDIELSKKNRIRFKFALVGELGMLSAYSNKNSAEQLFDYAALEGFVPEDLPDFFKGVNSFYSTLPMGMSQGVFDGLKGEGKFYNFDKPAVLRSWFVGVKFGFMLEFPKDKWCNCLNNNVTKPWERKLRDRGVE